jgi:hypothetical protein
MADSGISDVEHYGYIVKDKPRAIFLLLAKLGKDKLSPLGVTQQMNVRDVRNANIGGREGALRSRLPQIGT